MGKALDDWTALNDRQRGTLAAVFGLDQEVEEAHRAAAARGQYDRRPAEQWRALDFAHDPADRAMFGWTELQTRLSAAGWDNQGNGATMTALADRGLITISQRPTTFGQMRTVTLTRSGRAAARAGLSKQPTRTATARKASLSRRAWEVLALLWAADQAGERLEWGYSGTIERVLIGKHTPPLAASAEPYGYEITEGGRDFYRDQYAAHVAAHPDVGAPHPDGPAAEPWPARADEILSAHQQHYAALCQAWQAARHAQQHADTEAAAAPPAPTVRDGLPDPVADLIADQVAARHALWTSTAHQRAEQAAAHAADLGQHMTHAARAYAAAALAAYTAAVTGTDPLDVLEPPSPTTDDPDSGGGTRLAPPPETGIHAIDTEAATRYATATGTQCRRRGPAPRRRDQTTAPVASAAPDAAVPPGHHQAALADFLRGEVAGGVLFRRLHPAAARTDPGRPRSASTPDRPRIVPNIEDPA